MTAPDVIELNRFIEFKDEWFKSVEGRKRENMYFQPMLINPSYIAWGRRVQYAGGIELCEVHMADRGGNFTLDVSYEKVRELMGGARR